MTGGFVVGGAVIGEVTGDGVVTDGSVTGASVAGTVSSVGADDTLSAVNGSESVAVALLSPDVSIGSVSGSVASSDMSTDASRTADVSGSPVVSFCFLQAERLSSNAVINNKQSTVLFIIVSFLSYLFSGNDDLLAKIAVSFGMDPHN